MARIAGLQLDIAWEDPRANCSKVEALVKAARLPAGTLLVLPEMFSTGFSMNVAGIADAGGETAGFLASLAKSGGLYVLGGVVVRGADGKGRNQAAGFGPDGRELARYSKMQPFSLAGETEHYTAGTEPVVFEWAGLKVSPFICYDLRFPELFRAAVKRGAQLFPVIASWPQAREEHWVTLLKARAIENLAAVIGVNRCGKDPGFVYSGRSLIVDPKGAVLADAAHAEGIFSAELDVAALEAWRKQFPALRDMKGVPGDGR
jgi:predicted amidohydrolase